MLLKAATLQETPHSDLDLDVAKATVDQSTKMAEEDALNNGTDQLQSESTGENDQEPEIYHERQSKQLCALHALNNLFQDPKAFSKKDLDVICSELAPNSRLFNPHRSAFGLGCYDVNVIIAALSKKLFEVIWFDKRR